MKLGSIFTALYKGQQLANSARVKKTGVGRALIVPFVTTMAQIAVANGWIDPVSDEAILRISEFILTLTTPALAYIITATTDKIGFKGREDFNVS